MDQPVLRLLHIEDNPADADLLADILEMEEGGRRFDLVWEGLLERGLVRLAGETFHALLLDLNLPDSQGIEFDPAGPPGGAGCPHPGDDRVE